ncbi:MULTISPECIES: HAD family hydrolase [unclassified Rhizobium]|uniref:HAD family hydrolase n=1 Tax=Hyphomicrobiales TaxID=356 RepID=UPI000689C476|nr:HAD family hydrolase [Rhizobium sp. WW_1]RKD74048.1 phosphoglycolate phosphatase-like HAD superfamily hydrolase [Rhizobium sp. WW_1]
MYDDCKLAIFDIDGTLTDTVAVHQASLLETLSAYNFSELNTDWGSYRHHTDSAIFYDAWRDGTASPPSAEDSSVFFDTHVACFRRLAEAGIEEIAGASAFVDALARNGWAVVFATGSIRPLAIDKLSKANIPFDSDALVTASEFYSRTDLVREAIKTADRLFGKREWRAVSIGDGAWDLKTARLLDIPFVGIGSGLGCQGGDFPVLDDFTSIDAAVRAVEGAVSRNSLLI